MSTRLDGVGIALVETERVRRWVRRFGESELARVFTQAELAYARMAPDPSERLAARLAAKLALRSALGRGRPVPLASIEVTRDAEGRPGLSWPGAAGPMARLSISHARELSVASVWLEA